MSLEPNADDSDDQKDARPRFLPRLLPAAPSAPSQNASSHRNSVVSGTVSASPRAKRAHAVTAACEACRKRKSRCSADRPRCEACVKRSTQCQYTTALAETHTQALKRKYDELQLRQVEQSPYEEVFAILQSEDEQKSLEMYRRIKSGGDANSILRLVKDVELLMNLSTASDASQHSFPHQAEMPAFISASGNQYLGSLIYHTTIAGQPIPGQPVLSQAQDQSYLCPYLKPFNSADITDKLLKEVVISDWTRAFSQEKVLKRLFHDYFLYQHASTGFFHKDHFLQDMSMSRNRFCSQLLVNAILAIACHVASESSRSVGFWDPDGLSYRFLAEARRLWEYDSIQHPVSLTTIQAGLLLNVIHNTNGSDRIGTVYLLEVIRMAEHDDLFEPAGEVKDKQLRLSRVLTAWGIFARQAAHCFHFARMPWLTQAPTFFVPDSVSDAENYGEIQFNYPPSPAEHNLQLGQVIRANCWFWTILNDLTCLLFDKKAVPLTSQQVHKCKDELDEWYQALPDALSPENMAYPDHILLHVEYFGAVIRMFELLLSPDEQQIQTMAADDIVHETITAAEIRFETLLRLYYLRHTFDDYSPRIMHWLMLLGNRTIERLKTRSYDTDNDAGKGPVSEPTTRALRSTLILCAQGLHSQGRNYQLAVPVFRVLRDRMAPADVELLHSHISASRGGEDEERPLMPQYLMSEYPVPINRMDEDPRLSNLERLIGKRSNVSIGTVMSENE